MEYQLVLQFNLTDEEQFDWLCAIQEDLESILGKQHYVDGNDVGQGKMNIFIHTKQPNEAFELSKQGFYESDLNDMVAAYRDVEKEDYIVIWPKETEIKFSL